MACPDYRKWIARYAFLSAFLFLTQCTPATESISETPLPSLLSTIPIAESHTTTPTLPPPPTPSLSPTPSPTETLSFPLYMGTGLPEFSQAISSKNLSRLTNIAHWANTRPRKIYWSKDDRFIAIIDSQGYWEIFEYGKPEPVCKSQSPSQLFAGFADAFPYIGLSGTSGVQASIVNCLENRILISFSGSQMMISDGGFVGIFWGYTFTLYGKSYDNNGPSWHKVRETKSSIFPDFSQNNSLSPSGDVLLLNRWENGMHNSYFIDTSTGGIIRVLKGMTKIASNWSILSNNPLYNSTSIYRINNIHTMDLTLLFGNLTRLSAISPDGNYIFSRWVIPTDKVNGSSSNIYLEMTIPESGGFPLAEFSSSSKLIAVYSEAGDIDVYNIDTQKMVYQYDRIQSEPYNLAASQDLLAFRTYSGVDIRSNTNFELAMHIPGSNWTYSATDLKLSQNNKYISIDSSLYSVETGLPILVVPQFSPTAFSPDSEYFAFSNKGDIDVVRISDQTLIQRVILPVDLVFRKPTSLEFSLDGKQLVIGTHYGLLIIWDLENKIPIRIKTISSEPITGIAIAHDQSLLAVVVDNLRRTLDYSHVIVMKYPKLEPVTDIAIENQCQCLLFLHAAFSKDGSLLGVSRTGTVSFYDTASWLITETLDGYSIMAFSPDGTKFITIGDGIDVFGIKDIY